MYGSSSANLSESMSLCVITVGHKIQATLTGI
jgi:hypothetical protein